jgi:hypothetical protein
MSRRLFFEVTRDEAEESVRKPYFETDSFPDLKVVKKQKLGFIMK